MLDHDPETDAITELVRGWVLKAEEDWIAAEHVLKLGESGPLSIVCFHAQQCVEKYLKALLSLYQIEFPRTHNVRVLLSLLPLHLRPMITDIEQSRLNDYSVSVRYPDEYEPAALAEATQAVALAGRVRTEIRERLPRAACARR